MDPFRKMKMAVRNVVPGFNLFDSAPDPAEGERLLALGNFAEAEQFFLRVLDQLGERGHRRLSHSKILFALANSRFHQKKYSSAKEAATATLEHLDAAKPTLELAETHDLLATIYGELKEPENAVPHLEQALDAQTRIKPADHGTIILRRRKLAVALEGIGKAEAAVEHLRDAASVALRECGPEHQLTGDCEADLGRCLCELKLYQEAVEHLQSAVTAHLITPGSESEEVAKDYQLLATAYQEIEDLETAVLYYEKALRLRERQLGGSSADYATLLMSFASAQSLRGSYGNAVELLQQAVGKFEGLRDDRLGPALESLGTVYVLSGRVDDGIRSLKRARKIWEAQPDQNQQRLLANTQLFETVSGYLNPREATQLMQSINVTEQAYEQRPERAKDPRKAAAAPETAIIDTEAMYEQAPQPPPRVRQPVEAMPAFDPPFPTYLPPEFGGLPLHAQSSGPSNASSPSAQGSLTLGGGPGTGGGNGPGSSPGAGPARPGASGGSSSGGPSYGGQSYGGQSYGSQSYGGQSYTYIDSNGFLVEPGGGQGSSSEGGPVYASGWSGSSDPELRSAQPGGGGWYGSTEGGIPADPELAYLYGSTTHGATTPAPDSGGPGSGNPGVAGLPPEGVAYSSQYAIPGDPGMVTGGAVAGGSGTGTGVSTDARLADPAGDKNSPLLTDMLALRDALVPAPPPPPPTRSASLSGWDEMAFDFLPN
jgi:tetratricopeptide (TPR) repeat protein